MVLAAMLRGRGGGSPATGPRASPQSEAAARSGYPSVAATTHVNKSEFSLAASVEDVLQARLHSRRPPRRLLGARVDLLVEEDAAAAVAMGPCEAAEEAAAADSM